MAAEHDTRDLPPFAVVIPCYNAGHRVAAVVERVVPQAPRVIVVDDGCTDSCIASIAAFPVELVTLPTNRGKGYALLAGIEAALAHDDVAAVCTLDADGQHDPAHLLPLVRACHREQADLLLGARQFDAPGVPWKSKLGNGVTSAVTALATGVRVPDTQTGYRVLGRAFARAVVDEVEPGRYETEMEVLLKAIRDGYRLAHAPITTVYEPGNRSTHFRALHDSLRVYGRFFRVLLRRKRRS